MYKKTIDDGDMRTRMGGKMQVKWSMQEGVEHKNKIGVRLRWR